MPSPVRWISGSPASACRLRSCSVTAGWVRCSCLAAAVTDRCFLHGRQRAQLTDGQFPHKPARHRATFIRKTLPHAKDNKISLIWQIALLLRPRLADRRDARGSGPGEGAQGDGHGRARDVAFASRPVSVADAARRCGRRGDRGDCGCGDRSCRPHRRRAAGRHHRTASAASIPTAISRRISILPPMRSCAARCASAPVAAVLSEEAAVPEMLDPEAPLCVAIDPLDGSANLDNNISVGTIFSIRPRGNDILSTFFEPGTAQCAAGFVVYGPQTTLVLALDARVDIFILDRRTREFLLIKRGVRIASDTPEFAINASNRRHWHGPVRAYIDECLAGTNGRRRRRLQHALDRFAGRGGASHPGSRRRVSLSRRRAARLSRGPAAAAVRGASDGAGDGMGGRRRDDRAPAHSRALRRKHRTSACR